MFKKFCWLIILYLFGLFLVGNTYQEEFTKYNQIRPTSTINAMSTFATSININQEFHRNASYYLQCERYGDYEARSQEIGGGVLLMVSGVYLSFIGFPYFRPTMFIFGYILGGFLTWLGLNSFEPIAGYPNCFNLYLGVCIASGFVIGCLFGLFYQPTIMVLSVIVGGLLSTYICSWSETFMIQDVPTRFVFIGCFMILFFLLMLFFEFLTVIFSLAFLGGYSFVFGLDLMIKKGFHISLFLLWNTKHLQYKDPYKLQWQVIVLMLTIMGWTVLAFCWQLYFNKGNRFGVRVIKNSNDTLHKVN